VFTVFAGTPKPTDDVIRYSAWYTVNGWISSKIFNGYINPDRLVKNGYTTKDSNLYKIMSHVSRSYKTSLLTSGDDVTPFITPSINPDLVSNAIKPWCWQLPSTIADE
jgi:hypothetical protein